MLIDSLTLHWSPMFSVISISLAVFLFIVYLCCCNDSDFRYVWLINFLTLFWKCLEVRVARCKIRSFTPQVAIICLVDQPTTYPDTSPTACLRRHYRCCWGCAALANHQTRECERERGLHSNRKQLSVFMASDGERWRGDAITNTNSRKEMWLHCIGNCMITMMMLIMMMKCDSYRKKTAILGDANEQQWKYL